MHRPQTAHFRPRRLIASLAVAAALLVSALPAGGAGAQPGPVSPPSAEDIAVRDQLIANQENLLNAYRCLFGVDIDVVPGGCPDPDQVFPGPTPANPAHHDIEVRDGLIQRQEALLNVYRCRFGVDTELVVGGCPETGGSQPAPEPAPIRGAVHARLMSNAMATSSTTLGQSPITAFTP